MTLLKSNFGDVRVIWWHIFQIEFATNPISLYDIHGTSGNTSFQKKISLTCALQKFIVHTWYTCKMACFRIQIIWLRHITDRVLIDTGGGMGDYTDKAGPCGSCANKQII